MVKLICPFDNSPLNRREDGYNTPYFVCNSCGQEYSRYEVYRLDKVKEKRLSSAKLELVRLDERRSELIKFLNLPQS